MMPQISWVLKLRPTTVKYINKYFPKKEGWDEQQQQQKKAKNNLIGGNKKVEQEVLLADIRL